MLENARREAERRRNLADRDMISRDEAERYQRPTRSRRRNSSVPYRNFLSSTRTPAKRIVVARKPPSPLPRHSFVKPAPISKKPIFGPLIDAMSCANSAIPERASRLNLILPIVTLADDSSLRVRLDVDEVDVARLRVGQPAFVTAEAYGKHKFAGHVIRVGRILGKKNVRSEEPTERVDTKISGDPRRTRPRPGSSLGPAC